jgi:translocation and assembly module TamB
VRFKSVLGAFLFVLFTSFVALLVFVQTRSFGNLVTKIASDLSERKFNAEVKIKNVSLSVFPPGLELNKLRLKKKFSDVENLEVEVGKVGFYAKLLEIEEKKLTLGEVRLSDSTIHYTFPKKDEELKEIDQAVIDRLFELSQNTPVGVDTLLIENALIHANHDLVVAKRLKVFKKRDSFITRFHITNLKPSADHPFVLDEVWGDAEVTRQNIQIYRLKVNHDVHSVLVKGKISKYPKLKKASVKLNGESLVYLGALSGTVSLPGSITLSDGLARMNFSVKHENEALSGKLDASLANFKSNLFYADELRASATLANGDVTLETFDLAHGKEQATLISPVTVANLTKKTFLREPIQARAKNLTLNNVLRFLGPSLQSLKGELTGDLTFEYRNKDLFFTPKDRFVVHNLGLVVGDDRPFTVLMAKKAQLRNSQFAVVKNEFQMSSTVELANSRFDIVGYVNKDRVKFTAPDSRVDLEDLGNISNLDIKGVGELSLEVAGPLSDTTINIRGKTRGFEILGYKLDQTEKNLDIELGTSTVVIKKMESRLGKTNVSGNGTVNWDDLEIALGISSNNVYSEDLLKIIDPVVKDLDFLPPDLSFRGKVEVDIFGKTRVKDLKLRSRVNFTDLSAYGENLSSGSFDLTLMNQVLAFNNLEAEKGKGHISGNFDYGLESKKFGLKYNWENLELSSFNMAKKLKLNLNSLLSGNVSGSGRSEDFEINLNTVAFDTKTPTYSFDDSNLSLTILPKRIKGKANLLGSMLTSTFNIALKRGLASELQFKLFSENLKPILTGLFGQHLENEDFTAKTDLEFQSTFEDEFKNLDLVSELKRFEFYHPDFSVNYHSAEPQFVVKNSEIQSWNLAIKENDLFVSTKGSGTFGKSVSLVHEIHVNSKILEILLAPVLSADGFIRNIIRLDGRGTELKPSLISRSEKLALSLEAVPIPINDLSYNIEYMNSRLMIQEMKTVIDNGTASLIGDVFFDADQPDVNLKFTLDRAEFPILGKSLLNVTGEGIILGNARPYTLSGDLTINKGQIVNELTEFSSKSAGFGQVRFLPRNQESTIGKLLNLNVNVKVENPIRITNSLMDVALKGELRILGTPTRPKAEGRVYTPVNTSRIFFKNNEYLITNADINFNPKKEISNPDFDVQALTFISNYKVYPKAYGDLEKFNFDLTSEPALPRNSILSLIAFGYTDELQSALDAKDQQNLNQVGVGSFVFDRFKISDILNKQFGLQINLGTVIEQSSSGSLLTGRTQEGQSGAGGGSLGRTRSSTKIELKKRLDEALTLSVSSTMGGSIGQRQSMNLNYGLTKKIQLEGVFEKRTNPEGEFDNIDTSAGADLKFRWTFK